MLSDILWRVQGAGLIVGSGNIPKCGDCLETLYKSAPE
jgi:hypothetical protein